MIVGGSDWYSITLGVRKLVAVGTNGSITTSEDGINWTTPISLGGITLNSVRYIDGKFYTVGGNSRGGFLYTSTDGINWTGSMLIRNTHCNDIIKIKSDQWGDALLIGCHHGSEKGRGYILRSEDNFESFTRDLPTDSYGISGFATNGKLVVALGDRYGSVGKSGICYSEDAGLTWTFSTAGVTTITNMRSVCYGRDKFVAVGWEYILTSYDGKNWTKAYELKNLGFSQLLCVKYINGRFIATGNMGGYLMSTDGITWTGGRIKDENDQYMSSLLFSFEML